MERKGRRNMQKPVQRILKDFLEEFDNLRISKTWRDASESYGRNQTQFLIERYEEKLQSQFIHQ